MRRFAAISALCGALLPGASPAEDVVALSLDEAVIVAQQAVLTGDGSLGYAIAKRLVEADPANARAQLIIAATAPSLGMAPEGRRAGRTAWGLTRDPQLRYEIARHTAKAAFVEGRAQAAQFWLRRAADLAPTPVAYEQTVNDVGLVRDSQRLRFALDVSVSPSDNLNNGARGGLLTIDDWFTVGALTADALALSGVRAVGQAQLTYGLGTSGRTVVGLRGYTTVNQLSSAAQDSVDGLLTGSDLNVVQLEATLAHAAQLPGGNWPVMLTAAVGKTWFGGQDLGTHLRMEAATPLSRTTATRLTFSGELQQQDEDISTAIGIAADGRETLGQGTVSWRVSARTADGPQVNSAYTQVTSDFSYALGKPVGPVTLTLRAGGAIRDYPAYSLVVANVTGGRQDHTASIGIDAAFQNVSVLGYVPRVSVTATATNSNISRFETREIGISFGIQSRF